MAVAANTPIELINAVYERLGSRVALGRERLGRPLTFAEKVLINHLRDPETQELERARSYADLDPDRVAMQDATAQMALLQFMTAGLPQVAVPTTVHCDHLIQAREDGKVDLLAAVESNNEVYDFLESVSAKYGIGFWKPGLGHHPPGRARAVRLPRRHDDRHRQPHAQRRRARHGGHRRGRCRRGRRDDRLPVQRALAEAHRRAPHRRARRLVGPEGRDPQGRRGAHREGWHRRDRRVLRAGRRIAQLHRQGHHLQHGRRDRRHHVAVRLRPGHGPLPQVDRPRGHRRRRRPRGRRPALRPRGLRRPQRLLRPGHRDRPQRSRAADQRPPHARPGPTGEPARTRGHQRGLAARDQRRTRRIVHQLELRGHQPRRRHRPPGLGPRPHAPAPS